MSKSSVIILGVLRGQVICLGSNFQDQDPNEVAEDAVKQGRVQEAFVIPVSASFSASEQKFPNPDGLEHERASTPALNPGNGEQEAAPEEGEKTSADIGEETGGTAKSGVQASVPVKPAEGSKKI